MANQIRQASSDRQTQARLLILALLLTWAACPVGLKHSGPQRLTLARLQSGRHAEPHQQPHCLVLVCSRCKDAYARFGLISNSAQLATRFNTPMLF
jgi:hypothetical protein